MFGSIPTFLFFRWRSKYGKKEEVDKKEEIDKYGKKVEVDKNKEEIIELQLENIKVDLELQKNEQKVESHLQKDECNIDTGFIDGESRENLVHLSKVENN